MVEGRNRKLVFLLHPGPNNPAVVAAAGAARVAAATTILSFLLLDLDSSKKWRWKLKMEA